jgi:hypothetical protein
MSRSIELRGALPLALGLALALACGRTASPPESPAPAAEAEAEAASTPDGSGPPMYRPSTRSPAPMPITDPAYGAFADAPEAPTLGDTIADFEVPLADGGTFSLAEARRAGPVLVFFYRGFW